MKRFLVLIVGVIAVFLVTACGRNEEPKISVQLKVSPLTAKEYKEVETQEVSNPKQSDFQKIEYKAHIDNINTAKKLKIHSFGDWKKALGETNQIERYWFGKITEEDHSTENSAEHKAKIIFYAKGLSEKELKAKFKNAKTTITWTEKNNHQIIKEFHLGELMEIQTKTK